MLGYIFVGLALAAVAYLSYELLQAKRCACNRPGCGGGCGLT